ncbi:MAG: exopolysaccharide biosynthesis protein [Frankiaceae bacterium]|nr:exopolysaccharide biosynthesis protein [Arenimonas sp.]
MLGRRETRPKNPQPITTRALVDELAIGNPDDTMTLGELLDRFSERSFGLFLLIVMLPTFIPIPVGMGAVSGGLASLIGLQFLARFEHPWLPRFIARHEIHRHRLISFRDRMGKWLGRIERLTKPRNQAVLTHPVAHAFTGLLLVILGAALSLPLPLTNYPFGLVLLAFAFALIERDGRLMLVAWAAGLVEIAMIVGFSSQIVDLVAKLFS